MNTSPVSIVTPTLPGREALLLDRCMPSIRKLDWPDIQHIVVSDRNPVLRDRMRDEYDVVFVELNETWRNGNAERSIGALPWAIGSLLALGDYVGFCGDDDELLPDHVRRHVDAMTDAGADFSVSIVEFRVRGEHYANIGDHFAHGHLDSDGIMCRAAALKTATWTATGEDAADWRLVSDWMTRGLHGTLLGGSPTAIHHDGWAAR